MIVGTAEAAGDEPSDLCGQIMTFWAAISLLIPTSSPVIVCWV